MKKLLLTTLIMSVVISFNLQSMENHADKKLRDSISKTLQVENGLKNPANLPTLLGDLDTLILTIYVTKREGRLQDVSVETFQKLNQIRNSWQNSLDAHREMELKNIKLQY